jgi:O-antigen/teichoic acid export membrane protein
MTSDAAAEAQGTPAAGGFLLNVNIVFISQVLTYGLAFGLRVVLAQGLGDSGLGTYSLFLLAVLIAGGIANLGVGLGTIYFLNKGTHSYGILLSSALVVLALTTLAGCALLVAYAAIAGDELFVSGDTYWLYAPALSAVVGYVLLTAFLHGESRFVALQVVGVTQGVLALGTAAALWAADELDVENAIATWVASFVVADVLALLLVGVGRLEFGALIRPRWDVIWDQVHYGIQGQVANMAQLFNYRLDQFFVAAFVSTGGVGQYTVAVGLAESVWWLSSSVAMVMLPRLTGMSEERAREVTPLVSRNTLLVSAVAAIGLAIVSPVIIRVLFGEEFDDAYVPLLLLLPGIVAASATRVLGGYLFSQGKVIYTTYATFVALFVTILLDLALIPWLGVEGAAIASSVAYVAALGATLFWYMRVSGGGALEALVVRREDFHEYGVAVRKLRR